MTAGTIPTSVLTSRQWLVRMPFYGPERREKRPADPKLTKAPPRPPPPSLNRSAVEG